MLTKRVLIDNCVPRRFKRYITHDDVTHVSEINWERLNDPDLLKATEGVYGVLISGDKNLPHQNRLSDYEIGVIILRVPSNSLQSFLPLADDVNGVIKNIKPRETRILFAPNYQPHR